MNPWERRLGLARELLWEAGRRARAQAGRRPALAIERKGLQDFVTAVDREVEALFRREVARQFPEDAFLGEEGGGEMCGCGWVLDPIDGTASFLRGLPYWSITLALVEDGVPRAGWVLDPVHGELFEARAGEGAFRNGERIRTARPAAPAEAMIGLSHTFRVPHRAYLALMEGLLAAGFDHRRMGSAALSLAHVADGRLDGTVFLRAHVWDVLAGLLLVHEAGGAGTPPSAFARHWQPRPVFTAAPTVAAALEAIVARALELADVQMTKS